jgi:hypothetical protein
LLVTFGIKQYILKNKCPLKYKIGFKNKIQYIKKKSSIHFKEVKNSHKVNLLSTLNTGFMEVKNLRKIKKSNCGSFKPPQNNLRKLNRIPGVH